MKTDTSNIPKDRQGRVFKNIPVDTELLPDVVEIAFTPLDKGYQKILYLYALPIAIILGFCAALIASRNALTQNYFWGYGVGIALLSLLLRWAYIFVAFPLKGYALRQRDVVYRSGWVTQRTIVIPFERIQHSELREGFLERLFHLSKLKIYTAGGSDSDLSIPGLPKHKAEQLRNFIMKKTVKTIDNEKDDANEKVTVS